MKRRAFLVAGGIVGGGLALGYFFTPNRLALRAGSSPGQVWLASWVGINPDNTVAVLVPHAEMGQGILTSLPMMLAEEMEADWSLMDIRQAPAEEIYVTDKLARGLTLGDVAVPRSLRRLLDYSFYKVSGIMNLQITGASSGVRFTGQWGMRVAGAAAKEMLLRAAAERWEVSQSECRARLSYVHHETSGRALSFADLSEAAAQYSPSLAPPLKSRQDYVICGTPVPRVDAPDKVTGAVQYGIDLQLDNMQVGAVRHAPAFGGEVIHYYERKGQPVTTRPGVKDIVRIPGAMVVTADNFWRAQQALDSLAVMFSDGGNDAFNTEQMYADLAASLDGDNYDVDYKQGNGAKAVPASAEVVRADYRVPFLAHATMEPMNCAAHYHDGRLDVWVGTQDPLGTRALAAETAGLDMENVTVHPLQLGGGFGRRMSFTGNFISDAVQTAKRVSYPVKLVWSRAEDVQHDYYRPAVISRFKAVLDGNGRPLAWLNRYTDIGVNDEVEAAFIPYRAPHQQIARVPAQTPAPVAIWRSVEHSYQGFFTESFIDELAIRAAQDPLAYRLSLLEERPRHQAALRLAAEKIGWGKSLPKNSGMGIAVVASFGSIVAQAVQVSVTGDRLRVEKVVAAIDPGEVIHPAIARDQVESGIIFGLTAALYGEISIDGGRVRQSNFHDYRMVRMNNAPSMEVYFIESGAALGGMGEVGTPPLAPALCNAIFAASGQRIRRLPLQDRFSV